MLSEHNQVLSAVFLFFQISSQALCYFVHGGCSQLLPTIVINDNYGKTDNISNFFFNQSFNDTTGNATLLSWIKSWKKQECNC